MAQVQMKWRNFNLAIRIKLDSGAKIVLALICLYIMLGLIHVSKAIDAKFTESLIFIGAVLGVGLVKDHKSQEQEIRAAEGGLADKLSNIKLAKMGQAQERPACEDPGAGAAHG